MYSKKEKTLSSKKEETLQTILFVCMGLGLGGTEKTLVEAINALDKAQYDITLYVRKTRTALIGKLEPGVRIIVNDHAPIEENRLYCRMCSAMARICSRFNKNAEKKFLRAQRKYVLRKRAEYEAKEFFHNGIAYDYAVAYDMAQECVRFVSTSVKAKSKIAFHHSSTLSPSKAELYNAFDKVVGVNSQVAKIIKNNYPELSDKVKDIENYLDPKVVFDELSNANEVIHPDCKLVLCSCGRITSEKGFDLAVRAAEYLRDNEIDFHWFFVGGGAEEGNVDYLIRESGLADRITITGFLDNPFGYLEVCDIYVQPSYEEAHATTMVEGRILCKPMVSTDTASGRYFKEKYGCCIVTDTDAEALANGIIELYNDKEKQKQIINEEKHYDYVKQKEEYTRRINALFSV